MSDQRSDRKRSTAGTREARAWNLSDAKARFSEVVQRALNGAPQRIVRGGHDVVIVIAEPQFRAAQRPQRTFVELLSPLQGSDLDLSREQDFGRDVLL